jgi:hypothetical protein
MPKRYEAPTITCSARRDSKIYSHPAYGTISVCRISCGGGGITLFGSHIKHSNFITLRINTAKRDSNDNYDFIHADKQLIEVELSGVQFADLITSMNQGEGVPCTINRRETDWDIPGIIDDATPITESRTAMQTQINNVMVRADDMMAKALAMLESPKPLTKKEMAALNDNIKMLRQEIHSNLPFVGKCFDEKIEKTVSHAKGEVEAFVSGTIRAAGLDAIAKGTYAVQMIGYNEGEKNES